MGLMDKMVDAAAKKVVIGAAGEAASKVVGAVASAATEYQAANPHVSIKVPRSAEYYHGRNYMEVEDELRAYGFSNIAFFVQKDLIKGWLAKSGEVESVSILGKTNFRKGQKFPFDTRIVITYHEFRHNKEEEPLDEDDLGVDENSTLDNEEDYVTNFVPARLNCKNCNGVMELDYDRGLAICPFCDTIEPILRSGSERVEHTPLNAVAQEKVAEPKENEKKNRKNDTKPFKKRTLSKVILGAGLFLTLLALSNFDYAPLSSLFMLISGGVFIFSWIVGVGFVKNMKPDFYSLFAIGGLLLFFVAMRFS